MGQNVRVHVEGERGARVPEQLAGSRHLAEDPCSPSRHSICAGDTAATGGRKGGPWHHPNVRVVRGGAAAVSLGLVYSTSIVVQYAQRRAPIGISLRHSGHFCVTGAAGASFGFIRSVTAFMGMTITK